MRVAQQLKCYSPIGASPLLKVLSNFAREQISLDVFPFKGSVNFCLKSGSSCRIGGSGARQSHARNLNQRTASRLDSASVLMIQVSIHFLIRTRV